MLRRGRLVVLSVAVGAATTFAALPGQAETLRSGLARAQVAKIVPYVGIPSVGAGVGVAQAEVQGGSAHASAGMADFGAMGLILSMVASKAPVPLPDLPGPITADDRDHPDVQRDPIAASLPAPSAPPATPAPPAQPPAAATPSSSAPVSIPLLSGLSAAAKPAAATSDPAPTTTTTTAPAVAVPAAPTAAWEEAHASKAPASRARARGPELGVPGVLTFTGGESAATADGGATSSTVHLGRLALGGAGGAPEIVLSDLAWTARQAMGKPGTASFTIGGVSVAGQVLPIPAGAAPADVLKSVNDALTPLGLRLEVPVSAGDAAGATVSALVIQVRNPETVATLLGQATQPAVPVLNQMLDTLLAAAPDAAASRLVVNALLATGTTRGGGRLELGGAAARIGNVEVADLVPPPPPPVDTGDLGNFTPPFAAAPPVAPAPSAGSAYGDSSGGSSSGYESSMPLGTPIAPSGAAHTPSPAAAPGGSTVAARPVGTTAPGGASAPLVLGAALLAIAILALGDKLRLRRLVGGG
ncbi:MAG TPA: hypothetical protein VGP90_10030 [Acidimicrobiia bacterium]|nr:hypothetical protein [Acidimicrobiia bacterium]